MGVPQFDDALDLRADDVVGHDDVFGPDTGQHGRFFRRRAFELGDACRHFHPGNLGHFVGLDVRAQAFVAAHDFADGLDVVFDILAEDHKRWGWYFVDVGDLVISER